MNIVIVGHVDHGKSTIIGRLLADTGSLPQGKLEQVKATCRKNAKPFEYAFLLDALKDEQAQGITIDAARCFFKTKKRKYLILDAPGHVEFLKNMVTGASRAEAALLVIDAKEGVQENSRRHGYMLEMLGIKQICVLVNKMDLVGYKKEIYQNIVTEYSDFLNKIGITPSYFIPVSGMQGDNIADASQKMDWYKGYNVLEVLDLLEDELLPEDKPFRMPVQGIYKFTQCGDYRRIIAGTVETGRLKVGDEVVFYPSGKRSSVASIEAFNKQEQKSIAAGYATGVTLAEQIYVKRGEMMVLSNEKSPNTTCRIKVKLFWLGSEPMQKQKKYTLKISTAKVPVEIEEINKVLDASDLSNSYKEKIEKHEVAECILKTERAIAFDLVHEIIQTSRFVIVDEYEIAGGGIIQEALEDEQSWVREKVQTRNYKWIKGAITKEERAERYNQKADLILITGEKEAERKNIARSLEKHLFNRGKLVYYLGIGNVVYGVDADIKGRDDLKQEHLRRLAEVSNILLDAGVILIVTAIELSQNDVELIKTAVNMESIHTIWVGEKITTNIECDLKILDKSIDQALDDINQLLKEGGIT